MAAIEALPATPVRRRRQIDWSNLSAEKPKRCRKTIANEPAKEETCPSEPVKPEKLDMEVPAASQDGNIAETAEPEDSRLLALLSDLPSTSQQSLLPLLRRFGKERLTEVLALYRFLGDGDSRPSSLRRRCGCALHIWGPAGVGKTGVVAGYLKELGFKYVWLNCYCILSQADLHRKLAMGVTRLAEEAQQAALSKLESLEAKLPQQLRAIDRLEGALKAPVAELSRLKCSQVLVVLDHVEELVSRLGLPALEQLLALPEILSFGDMLVPLTISRVALKSLGLHSTREPPHVSFEPYSESDTLELLLRCLAKKAERKTLTFVVYGLQKMAVPFVGWNLGLLKEVAEMVLDAMPAGETNNMSLLQPLIEEACRRRVGFVHKPVKELGTVTEVSTATQSMSKAEIRLVLAAYLASRICKQDDRQLFLGRSLRRKRQVVVRQKDHSLPAHVQQPAAVTFPRLLAIYHRLALQPRLMGSNIFQALTKLKEAGLIRYVGEKNFKMDKDLKVVCRAELPLAQACAASLKIDLTEYLCK